MQTPCLIQQELSQLLQHSTLKKDIASFLKVFKEILSNLVEHPFDENYIVISKNSQSLCSELFKTSEVRDFLALLGYTEESDQFVYMASDENTIKLNQCLELIESKLRQNEQKVANTKTHFLQIGSRSSISPNSTMCEGGRARETMATGSLKGLFLAKHHQKEQTDTVIMMKGDKKLVNRSSDFAFNNNGYFHQSKSNRDAQRNNKCFLRDLFHKEDRELKSWGSPSLTARLI